MNKAEKEYNRLLWLHLNGVTEWVPPKILYGAHITIGSYSERPTFCGKCKRRIFTQVYIYNKPTMCRSGFGACSCTPWQYHNEEQVSEVAEKCRVWFEKNVDDEDWLDAMHEIWAKVSISDDRLTGYPIDQWLLYYATPQNKIDAAIAVWRRNP